MYNVVYTGINVMLCNVSNGSSWWGTNITDFNRLFRNEKSYRRSTGVKTTRFSRVFQISKKIELVDFCISVFLYFFDFCLYLGNEKSYWRSAGVKTTWFSRAFQISKENYFRIFVFLYFLGFLAISQERKELLEICGCQNNRILGLFRIFSESNFWISEFLYFCSVTRCYRSDVL